MKALKSLFRDSDIIQVWGEPDIQISGVQSDSRKISESNCFIAITGFRSNGLDYLPQAMKNGANSVVSEFPLDKKYHGLTWVQVKNIRRVASRISAGFFDNPSKDMYVIGVTGTNGKTTQVSLINSILNRKENTAKIGTLGMDYQPAETLTGFSRKTSLTTPEAPDIFEFFSQVKKLGCKNIVMEVSSVALKMFRVEDICFSQGIFTTFSGDHLDFHQTMEEYFLSKKRLFENLSADGWAVLNADDEYSFHRIIEKLNCKYLSYGFSAAADIRPEKYEFSREGIRAAVMTPRGKIEVESQLVGRVNLLNLLGAISSVIIKEIPFDDIVEAIRCFKPVRGRLDFVYNNDFSVLIDYAHTDKALENLLQSLKEIGFGRIILVFGAGGSRDKSKRPRMGQVASIYSDWVIVTSDNPRNEEPGEIAADIVGGFEGNFKNYTLVLNREKAIREAIGMARKGDILVIAGKGHEDYQIFRDRTIHFDDYEMVGQILGKRQIAAGSGRSVNESDKHMKGGGPDA
jgi:UDP-N-acetylmuramoyl-L-alanyl-D-glutamate--2,6-diaminopimelate ligase